DGGEAAGVPLPRGPIGGRPAAHVPRVMMARPTPQAAELPVAFLRQLGEEAPRPRNVAAVGSRANERERLTEAWHPGDVSSVLGRVLFRREVAAAPPRFVADPPVADAEGIAIAACRALVRERRAPCGAVAVFHPLIEIARREAAEIRGEIRFAADESTESREFVGAELIRIVPSCAGERAFAFPEVRPPRTRGTRADAVAPVVAVGEA